VQDAINLMEFLLLLSDLHKSFGPPSTFQKNLITPLENVPFLFIILSEWLLIFNCKRGTSDLFRGHISY